MKEIKPKILFLIFLLIGIIISLSVVSAANITVSGNNFDSIQSAVNSSSAGDTINLGSGTYNPGSLKNISVNENNIIIKGSSASSKAVLDASGSGSRIMVIRGDNVRLENIIFKNANTDSMGSVLHSTGVNLTIVNCEFINNRGYCGPILLENSSVNVLIQNCVFSNNIASPNTNVTGSGGAMDSHSSNGRIINCVFKNNYATKGGGALYFIFGTNNTISGCTFNNNSALNGGAIYTGTTGTTLNIIGSNFTNNKATNGNGGAIYSVNSLSIRNSNFKSNSAKNNGGAIYANAATKISGSKFTGSGANYGSAIYSTKNLNITDTKFSNNKAKFTSLSVSLRGGVDYKGKVIVDVSLNVGDNVLDAIYSSADVIIDKNKMSKNSKAINQKITLNFKNKDYITTTNNKGIASFSLSGFNLKGTSNFNVIYQETSLYTKISKINTVTVSQKTTSKKQKTSRLVNVIEFVLYKFTIPTAGKYKNVTKKEIKTFTNKSLITYTKINGVNLNPKIVSNQKNIEISKVNYPNIVYPSYKVQCSCGKIGYKGNGFINKFINKCAFSITHKNNKKSTKLFWNPKKVTKIEGEWTCSGCGGDFCAVSGYEKIKGSKIHLKKA